MNKIFKYKIVLYSNNYKLIGLITQPTDDHFISYYENHNNIYNNNVLILRLLFPVDH